MKFTLVNTLISAVKTPLSEKGISTAFGTLDDSLPIYSELTFIATGMIPTLRCRVTEFGAFLFSFSCVDRTRTLEVEQIF